MFAIILGIIIGLVGAGIYAMYASDNNKYEDVKKKPSRSLIFVLFTFPVALFTLLASFTQVDTGKIAVMTRFGEVTGQELSEGISFKNPLDKANGYDIKVLKIEADAAAASKDLQDVNGKLVINYRLEVGKVSEIHRTVGAQYKEKLIDPAVQEVFKASTAKYNATELITDRASVKNDVNSLLNERLEQYGIIIQDVSITNFSFSAEFTKAIEAKQVAQQQAEQAKFNAQKAEQDAQAEINRAKGSAEAQSLQQETLTPLLVQKQFIEKWDGKLPTVTGGENILDVSSLIKE